MQHFFFLFSLTCAAGLSPSKVPSFILYKTLLLPFCSSRHFFFLSLFHFHVSAASPRRGVKSVHSDDITRRLESNTMTVQTWFLMEKICLGGKKKKKKREKKKHSWGWEEKKWMSSLVEDKCFICFHTDFSSHRMPTQPFSTLYINLCSLSLHHSRIHIIQKKRKKKVT